jgi:CubicO group peptidase (beta-lactamase class C family)
MFRIGSVSKLFIWTAVMRLVEEGKLNLEADVNDYLGDVRIPETYPEPITLKHLLTHTPGFEDHVIGLFGHSEDDMRPLGKILGERLPARVRKPGDLASYSNHGTALAGYIVEKVSGMPWEEYVEETILQPLGMTHTTVRQPVPEALRDDLSKGYEFQNGKFVEQPFEYVPPAPAGAMSASAGDMVRFMIAHLQNGEYESARILKAETAKQMRESLFTHDPHIEGMAYGFMRMNYGGEQIVEHGGDTIAFHSFFVMLPERRSGFFVSYNTTTAGAARDHLLKALMDRYYVPADLPPPKPTADFETRSASYAGTYGAIRYSQSTLAKLGALFSIVNVSSDDGQLVVAGGGSTRRFVEIEPRVFREVDGQATLALGEDGNHKFTRLYFGGSPVAFVRLPWYEAPGFTIGLVLTCAAVFFSAAIGWPLAKFIRRGTPRDPARAAPGAKVASWIGWGTSVTILISLCLAMIPFSHTEEIVYGVPPLLTGLLWSTPVIAGLVALVIVCTLVAWAKHWWRLSSRLHYTAVMLAGVAFVWFLSHWNLLGPGA